MDSVQCQQSTMGYGYICDLLGSLIPPDNKHRNDYLRLEHITACSISKLLCDASLARRFLPTVPAKFFILLMQTTMLEDFKSYTNGGSNTPSACILHLVLHWPYEEFNLR